MNLLALAYALATIGYAILAALVFFRRPRVPLTSVATFILSVLAVWAFADTLHGIHVCPHNMACIWVNVGAIGWCLFPSATLIFTMLLSNWPRARAKGPVYALTALPALGCLYLQWSGQLANGYTFHDYGWVRWYNTQWSSSAWSYLYYAYYLSAVLLSALLVIRFRNRARSSQEQRQGSILLVSIVTPVVLGTVTNVLLPRIGVSFPELGVVLGLIWAGGLFYGVTRYGLLSLTPQVAADEIVATLADALLLISPEGTVAMANRAAQNLSGYRTNELLGRSADVLFVRPIEFADVLRRIARGETVTGLELSCRSKDGEAIPVSISARVMWDSRGAVLGSVWMIRDMTALKRAELQLRAERDRIRNYLDISGIMLVALNDRGEVTMANRQACDLLECRESEILGRDWFDAYVPARFRESGRERFRRLLDGGAESVESFETELASQSGIRHIVTWHHTPIRDETGKIIGALNAGEDATELRRTERQLSLATQNLRAVNELARALAAAPAGSEQQRRLAERISALAGAEETSQQG